MFAVDGSNWTVKAIACPGFSVAGKLPPDTENPVPEIESELIVTAIVPLEVTVTDFVTAVPTETLPNDRELALRLNAGTAAFSCIAKLCDDPLALAEIAAVCEVLTEFTFAVNDAEDAPDATVTLAGTVTALLLLPNATLKPPDGAAELSDNVHAVVPAPVKALLLQESALIDGANGEEDPLKLIDVVFEVVPCVAVSVTVCEVVTPDTLAAKFALVALGGTDTETGTLTALLLLARLTIMPLLEAGALNVTLQPSVPDPIIDELAQLSPTKEAVEEEEPLPCNFTVPPILTLELVTASTLS